VTFISIKYLKNLHILTAALISCGIFTAANSTAEDLTRFSIDNQQPIEHRTGPQYMKMLLEDETQLLINPDGLSIPVTTEYGDFDIPVGSLRALKFIVADEPDEPDYVIVRFHTGLIQRMQLNSRKKYIRTVDSEGRKLKVYYNEIMGILSSIDFSTNPTKYTAADNSIRENSIVMKDGSTRKLSVPITGWKFKTAIGTIQISSPMVSEIRNIYDSKYKQELVTIYGEIFTGRMLTRKIRVISESDEGFSDINVSDIEKITLEAADTKIPNKWLVWYLKSGSAVIAVLDNKYPELASEDGAAIIPNDIFRLTPQEDGTFACMTENGETVICRNNSSKIRVTLLSTGTSTYIRWKDVCLVESQKKISKAKLQTLLASSGIAVIKPKNPPQRPVIATVQEEKEEEPSVKEEEEYKQENKQPETLKLKTALGTIKIEPQKIAKLTVDQSKSKACVETVYGDKFIVPAPSERWIADLTDTADYEFPEEDVFEININELIHSETASNAVKCRLLSGDIICGTLPEQVIDIKRRGSRNKTIEFAITDLDKIVRDNDGELYFILKQNEIPVTPKQSRLKIAISAFSTTNKISFNKIETLIAGDHELPPTSVFNAGMTASLKGEILIKAGTFMQGSKDGIIDEKPVHAVSLDDFYIASTEVTRAQFAAFVRDSGYKTYAERIESATTWRSPGFLQAPDDPVVWVSWDDAAAYCNWRSRKSGLTPCYSINKDKSVDTDLDATGYRLPSEAEWEFAARSGGKDETYACSYSAGGSDILANYKATSELDKWLWTNPVKYFPPNGLGIYGMSGNVWEWCEDWYFSKAYASLQNRNIHNPCITLDSAIGLNRRVMRGGSFYNTKEWLRCASRGNGLPYEYSSRVGFRCARNAR